MTRKNMSVIALVVLPMLLGAVVLVGTALYLHQRNEPNHAALKRMHGAIQLGHSHHDVRRAYMQHRTPALETNFSDPHAWRIAAPIEIGARNWILVVEFQDGKVSAVRMDTPDGPPPTNGPPDK